MSAVLGTQQAGGAEDLVMRILDAGEPIDGVLTMKMDGIEKVLSGVTDIKQIRQVCIK